MTRKPLSSSEDFSSSLLDTVSEVPPSLSSEELVEVSTPRPLMLVPISSERPARTSRRMISTTQEPLPITSVTTSEILPVWEPISSDLSPRPVAPLSSFPQPLTSF
jgi:hypothetical protein